MRIVETIKSVQSIATGKNVLIAMLLATAVYLVMMVYTIPSVKQYAPEYELFDLSPAGYSYAYAMNLLDALGQSGRQSYLYYQLPLDFIYPALFGASFCLLLVWMVSKVCANKKIMYYIGIVPIIAALLDYMENIQIVFLLKAFPDISEYQVAMASATTIAKSGLTSLCFIFLFLGMVRFLWVKGAELFS